MKASSSFDFGPVIQFVNYHDKFKKHFVEKGNKMKDQKVWTKFLDTAGEKLTVDNYKSIMRFGPMIELWNEYKVAESNTKPNDTFIAGMKIDVSITGMKIVACMY